MASQGEDVELSTIRFYIEVKGDIKLNLVNNISYNSLPMFLGKINEYLNAFLFEFYILCQRYDYFTNEKKLKLFPFTLKSFSL